SWNARSTSSCRRIFHVARHPPYPTLGCSNLENSCRSFAFSVPGRGRRWAGLVSITSRSRAKVEEAGDEGGEPVGGDRRPLRRFPAAVTLAVGHILQQVDDLPAANVLHLPVAPARQQVPLDLPLVLLPGRLFALGVLLDVEHRYLGEGLGQAGLGLEGLRVLAALDLAGKGLGRLPGLLQGDGRIGADAVPVLAAIELVSVEEGLQAG